MRLLLVEDDALLGDGLRAALTEAGFAVTWLRSGRAGLSEASNRPYAAAVLDIGLPDLDGIEVVRSLRTAGNELPVLLLTARGTTRDRVIGFDCGADDYVVKTTELEELIARVRALIRRAGRGTSVVAAGALRLDMVARTVDRAGTTVQLSEREASMLRLLLENSGRVITRGQIEAALYGVHHDVESNAVEVHVHNLRAKLGAKTIRTVRGVGYTIERQAT